MKANVLLRAAISCFHDALCSVRHEANGPIAAWFVAASVELVVHWGIAMVRWVCWLIEHTGAKQTGAGSSVRPADTQQKWFIAMLRLRGIINLLICFEL